MTPAKHNIRTVPAGPAERAGRLRKAEQFLGVAQDVEDLNAPEALADVVDACVTLYVHAGIAAADAVCARVLKKYSRGENHAGAVSLLESVDKEAAGKLGVLLGMKTRAGYGHDPVTREQLTRARRAAEHLVQAARMQD